MVEWNESVFSSLFRGLRGSSWNFSADPLNANIQGSSFPARVDFGNTGFRVATALEIQVIPGDFSGDGQVDGHDFLEWQRNTSIGLLAHWEEYFGTVAPLAAVSEAVPEPTSAMLSLVALHITLTCRRQFPTRPARE